MSTCSRKRSDVRSHNPGSVDVRSAERKARLGSGREADVAGTTAEAAAHQGPHKPAASPLPWLSKDVDLTPPDGGPETSGPATYTKPVIRR